MRKFQRKCIESLLCNSSFHMYKKYSHTNSNLHRTNETNKIARNIILRLKKPPCREIAKKHHKRDNIYADNSFSGNASKTCCKGLSHQNHLTCHDHLFTCCTRGHEVKPSLTFKLLSTCKLQVTTCD